MLKPASFLLSVVVICGLANGAPDERPTPYVACVSNEKGGDVTIIDGQSLAVIETIPVGKRPRGIHPSRDGTRLYVALSGRPIEGPPQLDANGNPIFKKDNDDDDDDKNADHSADGIGVVDLQTKKLLKKIAAGSDPEQFAVGADDRLYITNEDVGTLSVTNPANGRVEQIIPLAKEPEGVEFTPDFKRVYVTCETNGDIFAVDIATAKVVGHFVVPARPRNIAFLPDGTRGFVPSESSGQLTLFDVKENKILKTVRLPHGARPMGMVMHPGGKTLYISTGRGGSILVIDTESMQVRNTIAVGKRPWGIALSPDGKHLFAANGPSDDVSVVDLATQKEMKRIKAGQSPWGVTVVPAPK